MLSKYSILALIGASSAAIAGPLPATTWPKFANPVAPSAAADLDATAKFVTATWAGTSYYRGYRNDLVTFPLQTIVKAVDASTAATTATMGTTARTWWSYTLANFPVIQATSAETGNADAAVGNSWNVCTETLNAKSCNGGISYFFASSATNNKQMTKRVTLKASVAGGSAITGLALAGSAAANSSPLFSWQTDILLGAFYHSAAASTAAGVWCTTFFNQLDKIATEVDFSSAAGFGKQGKCTWQFITGDAGQAPAIKPIALKFGLFEFQYIEWLKSDSLGSNNIIPATEDATYFTGAYTVTGNQVWLNPAKALFTANAAYTNNVPNKLPNSSLPGSVGKAIFYANMEGQWSDTLTSTVDQPILQQRISYVNDVYSEYNTQLGNYNTAKNTYNDAANKEAERLKDFFKATFDPPITVPTRPCPPSQPKEYTGAYFDFSAEITAGWKATYATQMKRAALETSTGVGTVSSEFHGRMGYIQSSLVADAATIVVTNIGHIWGRLGQGKMNVYDHNAPFVFGLTTAATNLAGMNISTFPYDDAVTGLSGTNTNTFKAIGKAFASFDSFKFMARPGAAENPTNVLGAKALAATGLAVAAVVATIA